MDDAAWDAMATVGRVARPHGRFGQVIVNPETDFPESRFRAGQVLWLRRGGPVVALTIEAVRFHLGRPIVGFGGIASMTEAETLAGAELRVPVADLTPLAEGQYYRHDLVGCRVTTRAGETVGSVLRVDGGWHGSHLVVDRDGRELLVPLASEICVRIDPAAREIVIDPPEGLLDLDEGTAGRGSDARRRGSRRCR
jgi:16S rRNA processing protein RimM